MHIFFFLLVTLIARFVGIQGGTMHGICPFANNEPCPDNNNMHFVLFTRSNPTNGQTLDVASNNISESSFNAANPTKIIIHGFTENIDHNSYLLMKTAFLEKGESNVILVDWSYLAKGPPVCYPTASRNILHVGECTAGLIQLLRHSHKVTDIHLIGHSLGAQTANYVAKHLDPILPRITGLDPAGPGFHENSMIGADVLKPSNAHFVDVIHTNCKGIAPLGRKERMGHVDFYLNDASTQPGCDELFPGLLRIICSHHRSILFFTESINSATGFYGNQCADLAAFESGLCPTEKPRSILMGNSASPKTEGVVAVPTNANAPFALGP